MGFLSKIGKVFKKVFKSKIFKAVLVAAAIYFTAGVGLAAMGSSFAASLPGITAAGQMVGLGGVGAIATEGAIAGGVAAAASTSMSLGTVAEAAAPATVTGMGGGTASLFGATEGLGAGSLAAPAATPSFTGLAASQAAAPIASAASAGSGAAAGGFGDVFSTASKVKQGADLVGGAVKPTTVEVTKPGADIGKNIIGWAKENPTVASALVTFGGDLFKGGLNMFAQKSAADAAYEQEEQDKIDRTRRSAVPFIVPRPSAPSYNAGYNSGVVNQVAGV